MRNVPSTTGEKLRQNIRNILKAMWRSRNLHRSWVNEFSISENLAGGFDDLINRSTLKAGPSVGRVVATRKSAQIWEVETVSTYLVAETIAS